MSRIIPAYIPEWLHIQGCTPGVQNGPNHFQGQFESYTTSVQKALVSLVDIEDYLGKML